jgi:hypothetical protein
MESRRHTPPWGAETWRPWCLLSFRFPWEQNHQFHACQELTQPQAVSSLVQAKLSSLIHWNTNACIHKHIYAEIFEILERAVCWQQKYNDNIQRRKENDCILCMSRILTFGACWDSLQALPTVIVMTAPAFRTVYECLYKCMYTCYVHVSRTCICHVHSLIHIPKHTLTCISYLRSTMTCICVDKFESSRNERKLTKKRYTTFEIVSMAIQIHAQKCEYICESTYICHFMRFFTCMYSLRQPLRVCGYASISNSPLLHTCGMHTRTEVHHNIIRSQRLRAPFQPTVFGGNSRALSRWLIVWLNPAFASRKCCVPRLPAIGGKYVHMRVGPRWKIYAYILLRWEVCAYISIKWMIGVHAHARACISVSTITFYK